MISEVEHLLPPPARLQHALHLELQAQGTARRQAPQEEALLQPGGVELVAFLDGTPVEDHPRALTSRFPRGKGEPVFTDSGRGEIQPQCHCWNLRSQEWPDRRSVSVEARLVPAAQDAQSSSLLDQELVWTHCEATPLRGATRGVRGPVARSTSVAWRMGKGTWVHSGVPAPRGCRKTPYGIALALRSVGSARPPGPRLPGVEEHDSHLTAARYP